MLWIEYIALLPPPLSHELLFYEYCTNGGKWPFFKWCVRWRRVMRFFLVSLLESSSSSIITLVATLQSRWKRNRLQYPFILLDGLDFVVCFEMAAL